MHATSLSAFAASGDEKMKMKKPAVFRSPRFTLDAAAGRRFVVLEGNCRLQVGSEAEEHGLA